MTPSPQPELRLYAKSAHVDVPTHARLYSDAPTARLQARVRGEPQGSPLQSPRSIEARLHPKQPSQEILQEGGEIITGVEQTGDRAKQVA